MLTIRLLTCLTPDQKIQSIKNLRAATGLGLKEAKDVVDGLTGSFGRAPTVSEVRVAEHNIGLIAERFTYERLDGAVPDAARLALRAALTNTDPVVLDSLAAGLPKGTETRLVLEEAAGLMRAAVSDR